MMEATGLDANDESTWKAGNGRRNRRGGPEAGEETADECRRVSRLSGRKGEKERRRTRQESRHRQLDKNEAEREGRGKTSFHVGSTHPPKMNA